jgi:hypothetical protein
MISKNKQNTDSSSDSHNRIKISKFNKKVSSDGDSIDNSASFNINFIKQVNFYFYCLEGSVREIQGPCSETHPQRPWKQAKGTKKCSI